MQDRCFKCGGRVVRTREYVDGNCSFVMVDACQICGNRKYGKSGAIDLEKWSPDFPDDVKQKTNTRRSVAEMRKKSTKTVKACADCQRVMSIMSRGLCGRCFYRHNKAGTLDKLFPPKNKAAVKKNMRLDVPNIEPEDITPVTVQAPPSQKKPESNIINLPSAGSASSSQPGGERILVEMSARDAELFSLLAEWANEERRSIPGQILHILDKVVPNRMAGVA